MTICNKQISYQMPDLLTFQHYLEIMNTFQSVRQEIKEPVFDFILLTSSRYFDLASFIFSFLLFLYFVVIFVDTLTKWNLFLNAHFVTNIFTFRALIR